ncbi:MAG TPA: YoaK family protein [Treponemataceae bacterium]|nr:YoaK family protein [Treponemataceae bacterium]
MITKLPAWVELGSFFLASVAGSLNVFTLQSVLNQPVSHLTGPTASLGLSIAQGSSTQTIYFILLLLSFSAGAALSGFLIRERQLKLGRRYGVALFIESFMIFVSYLIFNKQPHIAHFILAAACGLQNAMGTTYSGAIVRTTHLTGIFTDLGIIIGNFFAGISLPIKEIILFVSIVIGFLCGSCVSGLLFKHIGNAVLFYPAGVCGICGLIYFTYRHYTIRRNNKTQRD